MFDQATATATTADNGIVTTDGRQFTAVAEAPETTAVAEAPENTVTKLRDDDLKVVMNQMGAAGASDADMAKATGWVFSNDRPDTAGMWKAFGQASAGFFTGEAKKGKAPTNETGVNKNGQVVVGAAYSKQAGWAVKGRVVITVDPEGGTITLSKKQQ